MNQFARMARLFGVMLSAMAAGAALAETKGVATPPLSAFIEGEVKLEPHPDLPKVYRFIAPGMDLKNFNKVMLKPIEVWVHEDSPYKGMNADDIRALSERLVTVMQEELEPDYPVVTRAGPGVIVAHMAITDIKLQKKKRGLLGYTPIGFVATAAMDAAGQRLSLIDAKIEAELLDGATGERAAVVVDFSFEEGDAKKDLGDIEARLRLYAKRVRDQLDLAHGREPKKRDDVLPSVLQSN